MGAGTFREDLWYRLGAGVVRLPPLRERGEADLLALAGHFLEAAAADWAVPAARLTAEAERALLVWPWPGNVRELRAELRRAALDARHGRIRVEHLSIGSASGPAPGGSLRSAQSHNARQVIEAALRRARGPAEEVERLLLEGRNASVDGLELRRTSPSARQRDRTSCSFQLPLGPAGKGSRLPVDMSDEFGPLLGAGKNLGAAFEKLVGVLGAVLGPGITRRQAAAEADAAVIRAQGEADAADIAAQRDALRERARLRSELRETRRQENLEAIAREALTQLPQRVSEEQVDPDWVAEFVSNCQDVSRDTARAAWGAILAGEVAQPGAFSRRTLHTLRHLSETEANLFQKFCSLVVKVQGVGAFHVDAASRREGEFRRRHAEIRSNAGLYGGELVALRVAGLLASEIATLQLEFPNEDAFDLEYCGRRWRATSRAASHPDMDALFLTAAGEELLPIMNVDRNEEYEALVLASFERKGWALEFLETPAAP